MSNLRTIWFQKNRKKQPEWDMDAGTGLTVQNKTETRENTEDLGGGFTWSRSKSWLLLEQIKKLFDGVAAGGQRRRRDGRTIRWVINCVSFLVSFGPCRELGRCGVLARG